MINHPAFKPKIEQVEGLPGDPVYIRTIPASELQNALDLFGGGDEASAQVGICILSVCDESGVPLFEKSDAEELKSAPIGTIKAIADAAMKLNDLIFGSVEEVAGN